MPQPTSNFNLFFFGGGNILLGTQEKTITPKPRPRKYILFMTAKSKNKNSCVGQL
jgi:hypothetical protein